ncbi:lymphocyte-specific protein 1 isoform X2 [Fukomys damarensis]|uniref:lymphocyte-specific protein 1 isoform X2 n=1 Tax=Fukomys damarensis TaxID=885580 RepID=UPI00053F9F47|nr:lymphocyte-specific protein 1 isoform X2 [Fukomys damarensis]
MAGQGSREGLQGCCALGPAPAALWSMTWRAERLVDIACRRSCGERASPGPAGAAVTWDSTGRMNWEEGKALTSKPRPRGASLAEQKGPRCRRAAVPRQGGCRHQTNHGAHRERLTTQWSVEDEKEVAREQRRRERDRQLLQAQDQDEGGHSLGRPEQEALLKPSETPELDEDEGFGDWSQKPEQQQQQQQQQQQSWGTEGSVDSCKPPWGKCPEGEQEEDRPCENDIGGGGFCHTEAHLEGLCLGQEGPGPEEEPVQDQLGAAETGEAKEEQQQCLPPRTPSPLILEGTTELRSPPLSPTAKLADRTESLNRSIERSNSVKKSQPALPISKIDERLEQYTQAIESAGRTPKLSRQASIELPSMAVANTKSRWETGEVQTQSVTKTPSCKDIVSGDLSKKSLWEKKGDSKTSSTVKSTPSGKRYKFVATGHGKYEKVFLDEGSAP